MLELLAPVGNIESLKAAIYAGANAVYLGFGKFNARQKAQRFNKNNLKEAVELCHLFNVKVFITFNTVVKNSEIEEFKKDVEFCVNANVDAFIVTDLGMLSIFRQYNIPLHASTQMGIHNLEGAKIAKELGFSRIVLARETLFEDIKKIASLGLEIEYFVHGALCVCFSGGCLLSSFLSGDSGNRGLCKQPCRHLYKSSITDNEEYYLSPSDQCFIEKINELAALGVTSLKIEGRLKSTQYVGEVVNQYRQAIDNNKDKNFMSLLKRAYNRGNFTCGYNFDSTKELMSKSVQNNYGECIGKIIKITNQTIFIKKSGKLQINDGVKVFYNNKELGGFKVDNIREEKDFYIIKTKNIYPVGASINVTLDNSLKEKYENINLKLPITLEYDIKSLTQIKLRASYREITCEYIGKEVLPAQNRALEKSDVENKLSQIGDTEFKINNIFGEIDDRSFMPLSFIKEAKREIIKKLKEKILQKYNDEKIHIVHNNNMLKFKEYPKINKPIVEIKDASTSLLDDVIYVLSLNEQLFVNRQTIMKNKLNCNNIEKYFLKIPTILRSTEIILIKDWIYNNKHNIEGIVAENLHSLQIAKEFDLPVILGFGLNVFNDYIHNIFNVKNVCSSLELGSGEYVKDSIVFAYGKVNLMTLSHCPIQLNTGCSCKNCAYEGTFSYQLSNKKFNLQRLKLKYCYFNMYTDYAVNILNKLKNTYFVPYITLGDNNCKMLNCLYEFDSNYHTNGHFNLKVY